MRPCSAGEPVLAAPKKEIAKQKKAKKGLSIHVEKKGPRAFFSGATTRFRRAVWACNFATAVSNVRIFYAGSVSLLPLLGIPHARKKPQLL